jgi:hypothetical protein
MDIIIKLSELLAVKWIELYKKWPKTTKIVSAVAVIIIPIFVISLQYSNEVEQAKRLQNSNYTKQIQSLSETHDKLRSLIDFVGAESIVVAERAGQKIAVEIKSFLGASSISEFHTALGQFFNYRLALEEKEPDRILYLAIPLITYEEFFTLQFIQKAVKRAELKLLIYIENTEVISQWIP